MNKAQKRQEAILAFAKGREVFQIGDILSGIGGDFSVERLTVVRDLGVLTKKGFLKKVGAGRAVAYSITPLYEMLELVDSERYFLVEYEKRKSVRLNFNFSVFEGLCDALFTAEEKERVEQLNNQYRQKMLGKTSGIAKKEFERLMIELAWKSSKIEGNTYSLLETEALLKEHYIASDKTKEETQMILNHKKAFDFVLKNADYFSEISVKKIEEVHSMLVEGLGVADRLRRHPVRIIGTQYAPLDNPHQIVEAMGTLVTVAGDVKNKFVRAFIFLIMLSYIQPFGDGNKRTARLIANAVLLAHNYCPLSYRGADEVEYKKATILFYEKNNVNAIKKIFIEQFEFAVANYFL